MKKSVGIISLALCFMFIQPANAVDKKVIAIIDTAIDSSKFSNIIYEACFTGNATCPNGSVFQEGIGSANVSRWDATGMGHGHNVVYSAVKSNPDIKIVFIRISNIAPGKIPMAYNEGKSLDNAIDWVTKNASKYSIDAVSISQARTNFAKGTCPIDLSFQSSVQTLLKSNIATFAGTGNDGFKDSIAFPACIPGVFPVGALAPDGSIVSYSNTSPLVKVLANGCLEYNKNICVKTPDFAGIMRANSGTSVATPTAASKLVGLWNGQDWNTFIKTLPVANGFALVK